MTIPLRPRTLQDWRDTNPPLCCVTPPKGGQLEKCTQCTHSRYGTFTLLTIGLPMPPKECEREWRFKYRMKHGDAKAKEYI
jgi:hypothetical protein